MTSAPEVFVLQLSRASRKANRFVRHLQRADREDVMAAAIAWCWQNRANYSLTTTLDTWFVNAVRNAYQAWQGGETRNASEWMAEIPTGDTTLAEAEAHSSAKALARALPADYQKVALSMASGYTRAETVERTGLSKRTYDEAQQRIKQLRRLLPEPKEFKATLVRAKHADSDDLAYKGGNIDREIAGLEAMPKHGADCPPCWRCKWFEGYMPGAHVPMRMPINEAEVRDAVRDTEARKVEIAGRVRAGTQFT